MTAGRGPHLGQWSASIAIMHGYALTVRALGTPFVPVAIGTHPLANPRKSDTLHKRGVLGLARSAWDCLYIPQHLDHGCGRRVRRANPSDNTILPNQHSAWRSAGQDITQVTAIT